MVQVESMLSGTPVVASDLPGVRQPVRQTGMGELVAVADALALAQGIKKILRNPGQYDRPRADIEALYSQRVIAKKYEEIYAGLIRGNQSGPTV